MEEVARGRQRRRTMGMRSRSALASKENLGLSHGVYGSSIAARAACFRSAGAPLQSKARPLPLRTTSAITRAMYCLPPAPSLSFPPASGRARAQNSS